MPASNAPINYQHLFHALPENFLLIGTDPDATILDNTDSHVAVSLKSRQAAVGKPFFEAYPAGSQSGAAEIRESHAYVRQHLAPHTMPLIRYDLTDTNGKADEMYWQATHYPVLDEQNRLAYILQRTQNVTEQLHAQQAAAEAERRLAAEQARSRFILDSLPVLVWTTKPDGMADYFNPRWLEFTGGDLASQLNGGWINWLHPDDRARVQELWDQSVRDGSPFQAEYRLRRDNGLYRWVLSRSTAQRNEAGEVVMWVGSATDIHDQKQLVQEILEAHEQQASLSEQAYQNFKLVQHQRQLFYNVLMHAPMLIGVVRAPEYRFEFANEAYVRRHGGEPVLGRTIAEVFSPAVSQRITPIFDQVLQTGEPYVRHAEVFTAYDQHGVPSERFYDVVYDPYREEGQVVGVAAYVQEVTELVKNQQRPPLEGPAPATPTAAS